MSDNDPWDARGVENQWKGGTSSTKDEPKAAARRLQDLTLGGSSHHHQNAASRNGRAGSNKDGNNSWPFESSPCRWTGGKNTRPTADSAEINQRLFDPDFASTAKPLRDSDHMDYEEEEEEKEGYPDAGASRRAEDDDSQELSTSDDMDSESFGQIEEETSSADSFGEDDDDEDIGKDIDQMPVKHPRSEASNATAGGSSHVRPSHANHRVVPARSHSADYDDDDDDEDDEDEEEHGRPYPTGTSTSSSASGRRTSSSKLLSQEIPTSSSYTSGLAWNRPAAAAPDHGPSSGHLNKLSGRKSSTNSAPGDQHRRAPSSSSSRKDELSSSCHGQVENHKPSRSSAGGTGPTGTTLRRRGDELSSTTFHGPVSQSRAGPSGSGSLTLSTSSGVGGSSRRAAPGRTKSSDGAEMGLGAATLHGGTSVSRIRGGKRRPPPSSSASGDEATAIASASSSSSRSGGKSKSGSSSGSTSKQPGERRLLQRAMSIRTVKRPEEYAMGHQHAGLAAGAAVAPGPSDASASDRPRRPADGIGHSSHGSSSSRRSGSGSGSGASGRSSTTSSSRHGGSSARAYGDDELAASSSHQRSSSSRPSTSQRSSSSTTKAASQSQPHTLQRSGSSDAMSATSSSRRRLTTSGAAPSPTTGAAPPAASSSAPTSSSSADAPRRDLLVLLRDRKKVSEADVSDVDNRRLLHFLMLEHKMGIKQKDMYDLMRSEQQQQQSSMAA